MALELQVAGLADEQVHEGVHPEEHHVQRQEAAQLLRDLGVEEGVIPILLAQLSWPGRKRQETSAET